MKQVIKSDSPQEFEAWKELASSNWQPTYADLQNPEKKVLLENLLAEQGRVCCYCGRRIEHSDSHIEHFRPQARYPELALAYENMHASCIRETEPGLPLHCGHAKNDSFNEALAVYPTEVGCEQYVAYTIDGQIMPQSNRAEYMTSLLNLDLDSLNRRRGEALLGVFDNEILATLTTDELLLLRDRYRSRGLRGELPEFGHVIARYAEQLMV